VSPGPAYIPPWARAESIDHKLAKEINATDPISFFIATSRSRCLGTT